MFTSEAERERAHFFKAGLVYLAVTVFCALFGAVYEHYSHNVYSYYMIYAFAFPLVMGVIPCLAVYCVDKIKPPCRLAENLYNAGVASLTTGSTVKGVLVIYGTANKLTGVYLVAGIGLIVAAGVIYAAEIIVSKEKI